MKNKIINRFVVFVCAMVLAFCDVGIVLAETPENTHTYVSTVTKESTVSEKGEETFTCECGDSYTKELPLKTMDNPSITTKKNLPEGIYLKWKSVEGATYYKVLRGGHTDRYEDFIHIATVDAPDTTYIDENTTPGYFYLYNIVACNEVNKSPYTDESMMKRLEQPQIKSKVTGAGIQLSWGAIKSSQRYIVERNEDDKGWAKIATVEVLEFFDDNIEIGKTYKYRVKANASGYSSAPSKEVTACWDGIPVPASFTVKNDGYKQLRLSWNTVVGAEGYQIYRSTSKTGTFKKIATVNATKYLNKNLTTNKTYYYKVRAYGGNTFSEFTAIKSGTPKVLMPAINKKADVTLSTIKVTWSKPAGVNGYYVYRKTGSSSWKRVAIIKDAKQTYYTDKSVSGKYLYAVKAYKTVSGKTYTSAQTAAVQASTLGRVTLNSVKQNGTKCAVTVNWGKVKNATGYQVYKKVGKNGTWVLAKTTNSQTLSANIDIPQGKNTYWKVRAIRDIGGTRSRAAFSSTKTFSFDMPQFNFEARDPWRESVNKVTLTVQNTSDKTMRFYSQNAMILDARSDDIFWELYLVNSSGKKVNYIDLKAGQTKTFKFIVKNGNAEYLSANRICTMFRFDGLKYLFITDAACTNPELYLLKE